MKKAGKGCACHCLLLLGLRPEVNLEKGPEINGFDVGQTSKNACACEAFLRRCGKIMVLTA
ncbi:MAG: hypothetical protein AABZ69_01535, partial [Candidatus Binatota bacterium]